MNKKLRRIIACLALVLGIGGASLAGSTTANAAQLYNCQNGYFTPSTFSDFCTGIDFAQAGAGQMRVSVKCIIGNTISGKYVGPWVGRGVTSSVSCPTNWTIWANYYELR